MEVTHEIDNFIGIFRNVLTPEECNKIIQEYEYKNNIGLTFDRSGDNSHMRDDLSLVECLDTPYLPPELWDKLKSQIWNVCHPLYVKKYSVLNDADNYAIFDYKIQKTSPGQGYHIWHYENMRRAFCPRILVYTLYLNDVEEGGETEFLYANKRIKPEPGTFTLFPAAFTHTHRGNPPLSGDKYILTGWLEH